MATMEWEEIISTDDESVEHELLEWAQLSNLWQENAGVLANYNIVSEVLESCPSADVITEEWDEGIPGRSGLWHRISTNNPDALRREIRDALVELCKPSPPPQAQQPTPPVVWKVPWTATGVIDFLEEEAAKAARILGAVGGPYGQAKAKICRDAINKLRTGAGGGEEIRTILEGLAKSVSWDPSFREKVQRTMAEFPIIIIRSDNGP